MGKKKKPDTEPQIDDVEDLEEVASEEGARSFARFFAGLSEGQAEHEASMAAQQLVGKIRLESKRTNRKVKGIITIKLTYEYKGDACAVGYDVTTKEPKPLRGESTFFVTRGGNLTREIPRQEKLPFRVVEGNDDEPKLRDAPDGATEARSV